MSTPAVFDPEQVQKLAEIGKHLQGLRTKKGLSLEEIATKTMVQQRFLNAIEKGQVENLPEPLYIRGFIRRFAEALGVDGIALSESFPLGNAQMVTSNSKLQAPGKVALRPWHLYILYLAAVLGAVALLYVLFKPQPEASKGTRPNNATTSKATPSAKSKAAAPAVKPKTAPVQAQLNLKADAYLTINVDGQPNFDGILKKGETKIITAQQTIVLSTGNAGGTLLSVNGQPAKLMGELGAVKEVTLTPTSKGF